MMRPGTVSGWIENEDGSESYAELEVSISDPQPAYYLPGGVHPPEPGFIERDRLTVDGEVIDHGTGRGREIADHLIENGAVT